MESILPGSLVLLYNLGELLQGVVISANRNSAEVQFPDGSVLRLPCARFCLISMLPMDAADAAGSLSRFNAAVRDEYSALDPVSIANLMPTDAGCNWDALCALTAMDTDAKRFALFYLIKDHPELFYRKKELIFARDEEGRASFARAETLQRERDDFLAIAAEIMKVVSAGADLHILKRDFTPAVLSQFRLELSEILLYNQHPDLIKTLRAHSGREDIGQLIHALRLALGEISAETDPLIADSGLPVRFHIQPDQAVRDVFPAHDAIVQAFSIDDEDTLDYDDAISYVPTPKGWRLGIHIADVAARIGLESELYLEAERRISSLYLPNEVIPLFPADLTQNTLSLCKDGAKPVISLYVELDFAHDITDWSFRQEQVMISENLSYREVDKRILQAPFKDLLDLARKLRSERGSADESQRERYYWQLKLKGQKLVMKRVDNHSPARLLIEEMMVLYNSLFARMASEHEIPLIYRNVTQFFAPDDEEAARQIGAQAYLSTTAQFHPGIGSRAYVHASSPIRRFNDLINQYQFSALLNDAAPPFSTQALDAIIPEIEKRVLLIRELLPKSEGHWLLRYLQQDYMHQELDAVFLKAYKDHYLVELLPWSKRVHVLCDARPPMLQDIKIFIHAIDLENERLHADLIL